MKEKVQKAIDLIRPSLQADGGDVELIDVGDDGVVKVKLRGGLPWLSDGPDDLEERDRETPEKRDPRNHVRDFRLR